MKRIFLLALLLATALPMRADEGMWLPALISERIADMQAKGLKLSAEDLYSVNHASLKDAIVLFGGGCTGEVVSEEGLLFTNHHCGYSYIQKHSSVEHDYLKDGFWAMNRSQELPNPGLTVRFLERMEDVTAEVLSGVDPDTIKERETDASKGLVAQVNALYYGNQYFLYVFRQFRDVRLVGAPPSSIGKFGGETDNWMWPRHTGDFSIFRIYAAPDGTPADYSPDNVPYHPKKCFEISRAGVQEGDFTFVYGCPGSTQEYVHSAEVDYIARIGDPERIALRDKRLEIMKKYMSQSQAVRIQYSSKYASVANAWKKWQGETKGLEKMQTVARKQAYEARFAEWAQGTRYEGITDRLATLYAAREPYKHASDYYADAVRPVELLSFALNLRNSFKNRQAVADAFFKDYYQPVDREMFAAMLDAFAQNLPEAFQPAFFKKRLRKYGSVEAWRDWLYAKSRLLSPASVAALKDVKEVEADPAYELAAAFRDWYNKEIDPVLSELNQEIRQCYHDYMQGQMDFEPDKAFYPDANLTLRIAYGHVEGYRPADAVYYQPVSTLRGIMEKDNPDIFDYNIPQTLRDIYAEGGHEDQPVCFLATNHTTGGNSGSPVLNGKGQLVGINFDRVWEGTMSDLVFDPEVCRNISLDIRYLLFVMDRIGGASYLFDEMKFADKPMKDCALVVVDMLYDFIDGSLACQETEKAVAGTLRFIEKQTALTDPDDSGIRSIFPILFVRDHHPANHCSFAAQGGPWPPHCVQGTRGAEIHADLAPYASEELSFFKGEDPSQEQYSGFEGKNPSGQSLGEVLELMEIKNVLVCGIATEYCVRNTAEDLLKAGFKVSVLGDCIGYVEAQGHKKALEEMEAEGIKIL